MRVIGTAVQFNKSGYRRQTAYMVGLIAIMQIALRGLAITFGYFRGSILQQQQDEREQLLAITR
jgi:hypothetical protein